jgi:hypothetical protein
MSRAHHLPAALLATLLAGSAGAAAPTLHWSLPLPLGDAWRIVELREGNGIRHEEYVLRGQGAEDYRDRLLVQRFRSQEMDPAVYLGHIATALREHCAGFSAGGAEASEQDGLPGATLTAFCPRFGERSYGYVIVQKAILDAGHLFVVEREWRIPAFEMEGGGLAESNFATPAEAGAWRRGLRYVQLWMAEKVRPAAAADKSAR